MSYPRLANWIRFKKINDDNYMVYDLMKNESFILNTYLVWYAAKLDGSVDPYTIDSRLIKEDVDYMLSELKERNVIRTGRLLSKSFIQVLLTVWQPKFTDTHRIFAFFLNALLMLSVLPLSVFSAYKFIVNFDDFNVDHIYLGMIFGVLVGFIGHEFAHMTACLGYGGKVFEAGIGFQYLIPCAYVLLNEKNIKSRLRRVQVNAAGVEMNMILADICMLVAAKSQPVSGFLIGMIIQNIMLAIINLTFINGFDGMAIMSELLGADNIVEKAGKLLRDKAKKKELTKSGFPGKATIAACYLIKGVQIALPLLLIVDVLGGILCFL